MGAPQQRQWHPLPPQHLQPQHRQPAQATHVTQASKLSQGHQSKSATATATVSAAASSPSPPLCRRCRLQHPLHPSHGADHRPSGLHHLPPTVERGATARPMSSAPRPASRCAAGATFPDTTDAATYPPPQSVPPASNASVAGNTGSVRCADTETTAAEAAAAGHGHRIRRCSGRHCDATP